MLTKSVARRMEPITIIVDGGCKGNHEHGERTAYGSFAVLHGGTVKRLERFDFPNASTNNEAEYWALGKALIYIRELSERATNLPKIIIESDSKLLVSQVNGDARVKSDNLKGLYLETAEWFNIFVYTGRIDVELVHVPREQVVAVLGH